MPLSNLNNSRRREISSPLKTCGGDIPQYMIVETTDNKDHQ